MLRSIVVLSALAATVSLAGCAPTETENEPVTAKVLEVSAKGPVIKGTGYTVHAPKGWGVKKVRIPGFGRADKHVFDLGDHDGFTDNFSVVVAPEGAYDVERMDAAALNEMGTVGARNRRARTPVVVAGDPTTHVSGRMTKNRVKYAVEQYHPIHDDQVYVVTFSFSPGLGRATREKTAEAVLNTWTWTS
ncbi:hypothetical protein [Nocardioides sp.]|uniref:hypothetical protein n=1 Tax=Nocardioides sp. TaxID=35761 RepID=UPI00261CE3F0|nr:hypothetical protein [Nocardioides sp.]MCW2737719.1 hypothetical protein [Nocardioides sp.]